LSFYLDTSLLVSALGNEEISASSQQWLAAQEAGKLFISDWVITEFSSAQSLKLRTGQIQPQHRAECMAVFAQLIEQNLTVLPVSSSEFRTAARFVDQHQTGLRAGDALHLAICAQHGMRIVTLDSTLAEAATTFGVPAMGSSQL